MRICSLLALVTFSLSIACGGGQQPRPEPPDEATVTPPPPADEAAPPADEGPLPLWSQVKRGKLPNGLTYYVMPHPRPEKRVQLWLAVNAGSLQEDDDQQGLAHFVEHMAFNGTKKFAKQGIVDYLEKIGMAFGPDVNAYTSWDETVYTIQVPTDDATYVGTGLDILREWAGAVAFEPDEIEKERGVVLEEWRLRKGAWDRLLQKQAPILWGGTRYASRLPIGKPEIITKAPHAALTRFYADWYRPDLMAVIVVGDVDVPTMTKEITARFGDLPAPANPRPRAGGGDLDRTGTKVSIETDPELPRADVSVQNLFPHRRESHAIDYRHFVQDGLYHRMLRERLTQLARRPGAPFVFAFSSTGDQTREFESFSRGAVPKDGQILATLDVLLTEVARIERHGFTPAELERAKKAYLNATAESATEWDKTDASEYADELTRHFFEGELVIGRVAEDELARRFTPGVTLAEINTLARQWGGPDTRAIVITAPDDAKDVPTREQVLAKVAEVEQETLEPWVEEQAPDALMAAAPAPGTVTAERTIADLGVTEWTLSNGARVIVKPTDFENQVVHFAAESIGGTTYASDKDFTSARLAAEAVETGGVGDISDARLDMFLADKTTYVFARVGENTEGLSGRAATKDLETMLQLVHLRMTAPRRDPEAFDAWKRGRADALRRRDVTPEIGLADFMQAALSGNHPRRKPITAEAVARVDLDRALAFYKDRFGDASDFTFTFAGNVDPAKLKPLVETYLASLPGKRGAEAWRSVAVKPPKKVVTRTVRRGVEPKAAVQIVFHDDQPWSMEAERDASILGAVVETRLREILREDMGGVYGVGVYGDAGRTRPQRRVFVIRFGCSPENVEPLKKAVFAELARLQRDGVAQDYLDKVKEAQRRQHELSVRRNEYWVQTLGEAAKYGDDPHLHLDLDATLARATNDQVKAAAKRYVSTKRYVVGVMMPAAAKP